MKPERHQSPCSKVNHVHHTRHREIADTVRHAVLDFRDQLKEVYGRVVGARTILYYLHKDEALKKTGRYIPRAASTIHKFLREGGRIATRVREHFPLERPEPMSEWKMDFGQIADDSEFLTVMDRGSRISIGKYDYSLGYKHANKKVGVWLDAKQLMLHFIIASEVVKSVELQGIVGHKMSWNAIST